MSEQEAAFQAAIAGKTEYRDVSARDVGDGYILNGQRRFVDPASGVLVIQLSSEAVAATSHGASAKIVTFFDTGSFTTII